MNPATRLLLFGGRWNPLRLFTAGERGGWWDPSDFSTMFQDSAGTTPVTATGQPVGKINDKSGRGNHRTQATAASRPTLQQDASGFYYLSYDGVDDSMATASVDFTGTNKLTIFTGVTKSSDAALGCYLELSGDGAANNGGFYLFLPISAATGDNQFLARGTVSGGITYNSAAPSTKVFTAQADIAAPSQTLRANGSQVASSALTIGTGTFGNYPLYSGRRTGSSLPFNGREYGTVILGRAATATEISQAERFIGSKMGIAL